MMTRLLFIALTFLSISIIPAYAQDDGYFFEALPFADTAAGQGRIDVYIALPYSSLEFRRNGDRFVAVVRYTVRVKGPALAEEIVEMWTRTISENDVARTTGEAPAYDFHQQRLPVPPGDYTVDLVIEDRTIDFVRSDEKQVSVLEFDRYRFALSGILLVSKIREKESGFAITPMLTTNVSRAGGAYFLFFEAYNRSEVDSFVVTARYLNGEDSTVATVSAEKVIPPGRSQQWLRMTTEGIDGGEYVIELSAAAAATPEKMMAASKRSVALLGLGDGMPLNEEVMRDQIKRLRYVATQSEIDHIEDGGSYAEQRRRYADFWIKRDPTLGTPENEAMTEYFRRIDYANTTYRSYAEGWLTDMGRIYIVYGPPDRVERDPFAADGKPREIWEYYGRRESLLFVDQTGFGDFRLSSPVPLTEKFKY